MLWNAIQCYTRPCYAMLCYTTLCYTMLCNPIPHLRLNPLKSHRPRAHLDWDRQTSNRRAIFYQRCAEMMTMEDDLDHADGDEDYHVGITSWRKGAACSIAPAIGQSTCSLAPFSCPSAFPWKLWFWQFVVAPKRLHRLYDTNTWCSTNCIGTCTAVHWERARA